MFPPESWQIAFTTEDEVSVEVVSQDTYSEPGQAISDAAFMSLYTGRYICAIQEERVDFGYPPPYVFLGGVSTNQDRSFEIYQNKRVVLTSRSISDIRDYVREMDGRLAVYYDDIMILER